MDSRAAHWLGFSMYLEDDNAILFMGARHKYGMSWRYNLEIQSLVFATCGLATTTDGLGVQ